jgi:hypothetical protein
MIVFHGGADTTVHPSNAGRIIASQSGNRNMTSRTEHGPSGETPAYSRLVAERGDGKHGIECWMIDVAQHAWAGGNSSGSYTDPRGPNASEAMVYFFLHGASDVRVALASGSERAIAPCNPARGDALILKPHQSYPPARREGLAAAPTGRPKGFQQMRFPSFPRDRALIASGERGLMDRLECDRMFVAVVEARSFTGAAVKLGASSGQASKLVSRLEAELGVRLLNQTTKPSPVPLTPPSCAFGAFRPPVASRRRRMEPIRGRHIGSVHHP